MASRHIPVFNLFADRLRAAPEPHKIALAVIARQLATLG